MLGAPDQTVRLGAGDEPGALGRTHGVALFRHRGEPVLVLASSSLRDAVESRACGAETAFDEVWAWRTGSSFEADLLSLDVLREHLPRSLGPIAAKLGVWWLSVDREKPWQGWSIVDTHDAVGELIGPLLDRSSARRWAEMLDGEFELCREPGELRRAPAGAPCAYRDMGLCRATCEGGESMLVYGARLREAVGLTVDGASVRRARTEEAMRSASSRGEFERASVLRDRLGALPAADDRASAAVGTLDRFAFIAVARSPRSHHARLLRLNAASWERVADVDARSVGLDELADAVRTSGPAPTIDPPIAGLVARELIRPRRGGPGILRVPGVDSASMLAEVRRVAGVSPGGAQDDD